MKCLNNFPPIDLIVFLSISKNSLRNEKSKKIIENIDVGGLQWLENEVKISIM